MRLLLTGFEPFGGETVNPSAEVVHALADAPPEGVEVAPLILPVRAGVWSDTLVPAFEEAHHDAWLGLGQAGARTALSVERVGLNVLVDRDGEADDGGERPIVTGGPAGYFARLPVHDLVRHISASEIPALVSNHAGTYICNEVLYGFQHHLEQTGHHVPSGFIHLPYLPQQVGAARPTTPSMSIETQIAGVRAAVEFVRRLVD